MVRLIDVAKSAGVSEATASLALNRKPGISKKTSEKVIQAAKDLGYTANNIARGLAMKRTNTIGMVVPDIENPFFGSITRYIDENARKEGYDLILSVSNDNLELEDKIIKQFIHKRVDGVIVIPTQQPRNDYNPFFMLNRHKIPYVFCTTYYPGIESDCVMTDLTYGSYSLTKYLVELGHKDILFLVSCDRNILISKLRIDGYRSAIDKAGIIFDDGRIIQCKNNDFYTGYKNTHDILSRYKKPDTVMAINDIMALGAMKAIREMGLAIPRDISVAGYDDVVFSSISEAPLTTVKQDVPRICQETVNILIDKINGRNTPLSVQKIIPELIIRHSTGMKSV